MIINSVGRGCLKRQNSEPGTLASHNIFGYVVQVCAALPCRTEYVHKETSTKNAIVGTGKSTLM